MGKRISLWIMAGITSASLAAALFAYGCAPAEDPAEALLKAQGGTSAPVAKPAAGAPADAAKPAGGTTSANAGAAAPAAPGGKEAAPKPSAGSEKPAPVQGAAGAKTEEGAAKANVQGGSTGQAKVADKKGGEGEISEDERITNFQNLEPRDIIIKKYDTMHQKLSEPWNPEKDKEDFIPETGRIDPLNPVDSAVPDEFKPPRSGETDANQIETYLVAQACTEVVDNIRMMVQVKNVIKIGAETYVTIAIGGQRASLTVGQPFSGQAATVGFIPIVFQVMITSASADEVVLSVTAYGDGTSTSVSKNQIYLPTTFTG